MARSVDTDYLVVGAGAAGMAFVDALVDHDPTAHATLVDRRAAPGGHW
ncbi:MAG TPA: NAD(P)-binding protein, partial [Isoptericola sp.]|nr:NAD(P)-binding protein [Isoptericola sp.]